MVIFFITTSCNNESKEFCKCISLGNDFNKKSEAYLKGEKVNEQKVKEAKEEMNKACDKFKTMPAAELQKLKNVCDS